MLSEYTQRLQMLFSIYAVSYESSKTRAPEVRYTLVYFKIVMPRSETDGLTLNNVSRHDKPRRKLEALYTKLARSLKSLIRKLFSFFR